MAEEKDIQYYRKIFPNGTEVTHILGGRGEIKTLENDWDTDDPPTVVALIHPLNTTFPNIRRIPVTELQRVIGPIPNKILLRWKKEALSFKEDVGDMREAEPVMEILARLLLTIQDLQERNL